MENDYVATIMDRVYLGDQNFFFFHSFTTPGSYDPKSRIFTDQNGLEYMPITSPDALQSEVTRGFNNLVKMSDLPNEVGKATIDEAIPEYYELCSRFVCYVSVANNVIIFVIPMNYIAMRDHINDMIAGKKTFDGLQVSGVDKVIIPYQQPLETQEQRVTVTPDEGEKEDEAEDEEEETKQVMFQGVLTPEQSQFLKDMLDGKIPLEKLRELREQIKREAQETVIEGEDRELNKRINIDEIYNQVIKTLIAQDEPARNVIAEITRKIENEECNERGILITGQTGCGKTELMKLIAKYLGRPFIKIDSTQLTVPGYVGKNLEEEFWKLYIKCGRNKEKAERAVVCFGEIDKKGSSSKEDISGRGVLNVLLPVFDGTTYDACENVQAKTEVVPIETRNMIFAFDGAFEDVYKELNKRGIGFGSTAVVNKDDEGEVLKAFMDVGQMSAEFMGRVDIFKLNDMNLENLERVLRESDKSPVLTQQKVFGRLGTKLTAKDDFIEEIAQRAIKRKSGCRGLDSAVNRATLNAYDDVHCHEGEYDEVIIGRETVQNPKQYVKIPRKSSEE